MYIPEIELSVKFKNNKNQLRRKISSSRQMHEAALEIFNADQIEYVEEFLMICLNIHHEVMGFYKVSKGGFASTIVDVKVIAINALQSLGSKVIIMHNHPSGNLKPSEADKHITAKIKTALELLDIQLIDHMIITNDAYYSFADEGII